MIADRDHILFEYLEKENGKAIHERFRGFTGHVQADAKSVFNLLFADSDELRKKQPDIEHDGCVRVEVGCWRLFAAQRSASGESALRGSVAGVKTSSRVCSSRASGLRHAP